MLQKHFRKLHFRPRSKPLVPLPLNIRSVGHYSVPSDWREDTEPRLFHQLFWTIRGAGIFHLGSEETVCGPGEIFLYRPMESHRLSCRTPAWEYRWLTLDGPDTEHCLAGFGLRRTASPGRCPAGLFDRLHRIITQTSRLGEQRSSIIGYAILAEAGQTAETSPLPATLFQKCRTLIEERFSDPNLSIEAIADHAGVHRASIYRLFQSSAGMSPVHYLQSVRLQKGLAYLAESDQPIAEIAVRCGFRDANYFARVIREATGMTPRELRAQTRL